MLILMLIPVPISCLDDDVCLDMYVEPYYRMLDLVFENVEIYYLNDADKPMPLPGVSQDYDTHVYPCDSLLLSFFVPDTSILYHSQNNIMKKGFCYTQEAFACNIDRAGYKGTLDLVDKIHISSNYDFDEKHHAGYDLSDIVDIFAYTKDEVSGGKWNLHQYNENSPHEAPKRFWLLIRQKPTISKVHQFVIRYHLVGQDGTAPREFHIITPVFNVR